MSYYLIKIIYKVWKWFNFQESKEKMKEKKEIKTQIY
jgi:hypothetical protein